MFLPGSTVGYFDVAAAEGLPSGRLTNVNGWNPVSNKRLTAWRRQIAVSVRPDRSAVQKK